MKFWKHVLWSGMCTRYTSPYWRFFFKVQWYITLVAHKYLDSSMYVAIIHERVPWISSGLKKLASEWNPCRYLSVWLQGWNMPFNVLGIVFPFQGGKNQANWIDMTHQHAFLLKSFEPRVQFLVQIFIQFLSP